MWWLYIALGLVILAAFRAAIKRNRLKSEYDLALKGTDKKKALKAGRAYYSSLRSGSLTIYDEQAITNDLQSMKPDATNNESKQSVIERLEKLGDLKTNGVLTEDEFNQQKAKLLKE